MPSHVRKGDSVVVIAGNLRALYPNQPDRRIGRVLEVHKDTDQVTVEHPELVIKKHVRRSQQNPEGGVVEKYRRIHMSNVVPAVDGKPTRARFEKRDDGSKVRVAARNGQVIGQPLKKAKK